MNSQLQINITGEKFSAREISILFFILLSVFVLRFPSFLQPWGGDQAVYGYIAKEMLDGKVPYRDMYSSTGYGVFFAYAVLLKIFGNNMLALHLGDFIASILTVIIVYYLTRLLYGKECAIIAGIIAALFGSGRAFSGLYEMKGAWGTYWQLAQREVFMTPLIAAGILLSLLADRNRKWHLYFWAGVSIGLAVVLKITAVIMLPILILYIVMSEFFSHDGGGFRSSLYKTAGLIFGALVIQLPFLYYFWIHDSLYIMYKAVFVHTSVYAKLSRGLMLVNAFEGNTYVMSENLVMWVFSLGAMLHLLAHERKRETFLVLAWTVGILIMIWGQGKFFGYHFLLILGPLSVLTGYGIKQFLKMESSWKDSIIAARNNMIAIVLWVFLAGSLVVFLGSNYDYYRWNIQYLTGKITRDQYYEVFNEFPLHLYSFRSDYDVVNYLKMHAQPGDSLRTINCGGDTIIHYLSGLRSATRFTSTWYLFNKGLYNNTLSDQLRDEFIEGISKEKPGYILLVYYNMEEFMREYNRDDYGDVARLMDYIKDNYVVEKAFRDRRTLYRRI